MSYTLAALLADYDDSGHTLDVAMAFIAGANEFNEPVKETKESHSMTKALKKTLAVARNGCATISKAILKRSQPFPFESLPVEIRIRIYKLILPRQGIRLSIIQTEYRNMGRFFPSRNALAITLVSRAIRDEAFGEMARQCLVYLHHDDTRHTTKALSAMPPAFVKNIKQLEIFLSANMVQHYLLHQILNLSIGLRRIQHIKLLTINLPRNWLNAQTVVFRLLDLVTEGKIAEIHVMTTYAYPDDLDLTEALRQVTGAWVDGRRPTLCAKVYGKTDCVQVDQLCAFCPGIVGSWSRWTMPLRICETEMALHEC